MKVTVVVPSIVGNEHYLKMSIESILKNKPYELIIVVGNNEQLHKAKKILDNSKIKYIIQERPNLNGARYTGALYAKGDIIVYTDDDTIMSEGYIKNIIKFFEQNPDIDGIGGEIRTIKENHEITCYGAKSAWIKERSITYLAGANMAYRKSVLTLPEVFDFDVQPSDDAQIGLALTKLYKKKLKIIPGIIIYHQKLELWRDIKQFIKYGVGKWKLIKWGLKHRILMNPVLYSPVILTGLLILLVFIIIFKLWYLLFIFILAEVWFLFTMFTNFKIQNKFTYISFIHIKQILLLIGFYKGIWLDFKNFFKILK